MRKSGATWNMFRSSMRRVCLEAKIATSSTSQKERLSAAATKIRSRSASLGHLPLEREAARLGEILELITRPNDGLGDRSEEGDHAFSTCHTGRLDASIELEGPHRYQCVLELIDVLAEGMQPPVERRERSSQTANLVGKTVGERAEIVGRGRFVVAPLEQLADEVERRLGLNPGNRHREQHRAEQVGGSEDVIGQAAEDWSRLI